MMLSSIPTVKKIFRLGEKVQILDPKSSIWVEAIIKGFENEWCVRVNFTAWSGKHRKCVFSVPEDRRQLSADHWLIRKDRTRDKIVLGKRRAVEKLDKNTDLLSRDEKVHFERDGKIRQGSVLENDPWINKCLVSQFDGYFDTEEEPRETWVAYNQLKNPGSSKNSIVIKKRNEPLPDEFVKFMIDDSQRKRSQEPVASSSSVETMSKKSKKQPPKQNPMIEISSFLEQYEGEENVTLKYVPCVNGVLHVNAIAIRAGEKYGVKNLEFDASTKMAFAQMTSVSNENITLRMPAVLVELDKSALYKVCSAFVEKLIRLLR